MLYKPQQQNKNIQKQPNPNHHKPTNHPQCCVFVCVLPPALSGGWEPGAPGLAGIPSLCLSLTAKEIGETLHHCFAMIASELNCIAWVERPELPQWWVLTESMKMFGASVFEGPFGTINFASVRSASCPTAIICRMFGVRLSGDAGEADDAATPATPASPAKSAKLAVRQKLELIRSSEFGA